MKVAEYMLDPTRWQIGSVRRHPWKGRYTSAMTSY